MRRIIIQDFGSIKKADIQLKNINVIIGEQSVGKSCVLKVACFCSWVEKRIVIEQTGSRFSENNVFIEELTNFHRLNGYTNNKTKISYESDFIKFSYSNADGFSFEWKTNRWNYKRPKVSYIPAERNLVAVIPNWFEVKSVADNIQEFMADWSDARQSLETDMEILNLNVAYHYDESNGTDQVKLNNDNYLPFMNVSSGLQSLIPLYLHLKNITSKKYKNKEDNSVKHKSEIEKLTETLIDYYQKNIGEVLVQSPSNKIKSVKEKIGGEYIPNPEMTQWLHKCLMNISRIDHCEVFLEEPELNLFPPTQQLLTRTLLQFTKENKNNTLFLSTHSPYVLDVLLEQENCDFGFFYIQSSETGSVVKTATEEEIQDMFEDGVDAFFNIERFGNEI